MGQEPLSRKEMVQVPMVKVKELQEVSWRHLLAQATGPPSPAQCTRSGGMKHIFVYVSWNYIKTILDQ